MSLDLEEIKARCEAAAPGPWRSEKCCDVCGGSGVFYGEKRDFVYMGSISTNHKANAEFIAHARQDIPALIAEVERLGGELEEAQRDKSGDETCRNCAHATPPAQDSDFRMCWNRDKWVHASYACEDWMSALKKQNADLREGLEMRPEVLAFAHEMERVLKENDYKGGWDVCDIGYLLACINNEVKELTRELDRWDRAGEDFYGIEKNVLKEAVDVANFAMMIADNWGGLPEKTVKIRQTLTQPAQPTQPSDVIEAATGIKSAAYPIRSDDTPSVAEYLRNKPKKEECPACEGRGHCENVGAEVDGKFYGAECSMCGGSGEVYYDRTNEQFQPCPKCGGSDE